MRLESENGCVLTFKTDLLLHRHFKAPEDPLLEVLLYRDDHISYQYHSDSEVSSRFASFMSLTFRTNDTADSNDHESQRCENAS
jgi:hypothetical protein